MSQKLDFPHYWMQCMENQFAQNMQAFVLFLYLTYDMVLSQHISCRNPNIEVRSGVMDYMYVKDG